MKNKNNETIYIEADEEIISIVDKLRQSESEEITLAVPVDALLLRSVVNLKILKKKASEFKKNISIVTVDKNDQDENEQKIEIKNEKADIKIGVVRKKKIKMFDIVKKVDKISDENKEDNKAQSSLESSEEKLQRGESFAENIESEDIVVDDILQRDEREEILDIKKNAENKLNLSATNQQAKNDFKKTKKRRAILPSISSKVFAGFIFICIATATLTAVFVFPKVDLIIVLKAQETEYNFEFITDESISEIDAVFDKIPAERIEVVNEETETYPTTGKKRMTEKASGEITVYNEYSSNPQKLVGNSVEGYTRFLSKDGRLFRIKKSIIVPGFSRVEGVDIPGQVTTMVYADKPGEEYNIDPASFALPALQGAKYKAIYAKSTKAMSGGIDKDVAYFSESDYITAKDKLAKKIKEKSEQDFSGKISDEVILLEKTKQEGDAEVKVNIKVGDIADNFEMTISTKTSALVVNKNNLESLIGKKINSELGENVELVAGSGKYKVGETTKDENGNVAMSVRATRDLVTKVDADKIREEITGKNEEELNDYFNNKREIKSAEVEFWPFWVKSVPASYDKINIEFEG